MPPPGEGTWRGGWGDAQIRAFAKRFAYVHKDSWHAYVPTVRKALIDSFILDVVLGQRTDGAELTEIRSLRDRLGVRLAEFHSMPNPIGDGLGPERLSEKGTE